MTTSGGCHTCKVRHVKCDKTKPTCHRCDKANRICIMEPAQQRATFAIHAENEFASGRSKRPRGPRSQLVKEAQIDLETRALAYYHQFHLQVIPDAPVAISGISECVAYWQASGRVDDMVDLALLSMALAVYSRIHQDEAAAVNASSKYCLLLQVVQKRIADIELPTCTQHEIDACLLTIFVMGRFEGVAQSPDSKDPGDAFKLSQSFSHHDGASALLNVWNERFSHQSASEIVKQTRRGQIRSAIMRSRPVSDSLLDGERYGECGSELDYDRVTIRLVLLRQRVVLAQAEAITTAELQALRSEIEDIDTALQDWMGKMLPHCPRRQHHIQNQRSTPQLHLYSSMVYSYSGRGDAAVWNQYYAASILVISMHLRIVDMEFTDDAICSTDKEQQCSTWSRLLDTTSEDMASSIPFFMGRLQLNETEPTDNIARIQDETPKPYILTTIIWPLTVAASVPEVNREQQRWFRSELAYIGKVCGGGMIASADTDQWTLSI